MPFYFGTDSGTADNYCGMDFYIGRLGIGSSTDTAYSSGNGPYFRISAANKAGRYDTYGYWYVKGPDSDDNGGRTPYYWGHYQGTLAVNAWYDGDFSSYVYRKTIFGDVERPGTYGWGSKQSRNQSVVKGFCDALNYDYNIQAGIYSTNYQWGEICGSTYSPSDAGAKTVWEANLYYNKEASDSCPTGMKYNDINGDYPDIVQYSQMDASGNYSDRNIASRLPE